MCVVFERAAIYEDEILSEFRVLMGITWIPLRLVMQQPTNYYITISKQIGLYQQCETEGERFINYWVLILCVTISERLI